METYVEAFREEPKALSRAVMNYETSFEDYALDTADMEKFGSHVCPSICHLRSPELCERTVHAQNGQQISSFPNPGGGVRNCGIRLVSLAPAPAPRTIAAVRI